MNPGGLWVTTLGMVSFGFQKFKLSRPPVGLATRSGFTLVEVVITVFLLSVILSLAFPSLLGMRDQNSRLKCLAHLRQIQAAKDAYTLDHLGEGSPDGLADREAVFRSYFVEGFTDQSLCPVNGAAYPDLYNVYVRTTCPLCGSDEMGGSP